jgi:hypothetical protein
LLELENYLGADAFAGHGYPGGPWRVTLFDLSENRPAGVARQRGCRWRP